MSLDARVRNMGIIPPRATRFIWISDPSRPLLHNWLNLVPREYILMRRIPRKTLAQVMRNPKEKGQAVQPDEQEPHPSRQPCLTRAHWWHFG